MLGDGEEHAFRPVQNVIVPETQHGITVFGKRRRSLVSVADGGSMLPAIQFDDQVCFAAGEIGDVPVDRLLANEFEAKQPPIAQVMPELSLGVGGGCAQLLGGAGCKTRFQRAHRKAPSPGLLTQSDLSPKGEVTMGHGLASASPLPGGRGRRAAAGEGALPAFGAKPLTPRSPPSPALRATGHPRRRWPIPWRCSRPRYARGRRRRGT